jgi:hypothetical protein
LPIADCRLLIEGAQKLIGNQKSAIGNVFILWMFFAIFEKTSHPKIRKLAAKLYLGRRGHHDSKDVSRHNFRKQSE